MTPAEYQKELRTKRKEQNLCICCGKPSRINRSTCQPCQEKKSRSSILWRNKNKEQFNKLCKSRYSSKKNLGLCTKCNLPPEPNKTLCKNCRNRVGEGEKKRYDRDVLAGRCVDCGHKSETNRVLCEICRNKRKASNLSNNREYREENLRKILFSMARIRARKRGIYFDPNLSWRDIPDPNSQKCPVFETEFIMGNGQRGPQSATLDRIDPNLGYVRGNIQLLSSLANDIKSNAEEKLIWLVGISVQNKEQNLECMKDSDEQTQRIRQKIVSQKRSANKLKRNLEFTIRWYDISLPEFCPCTGEKIQYQDKSDWRYRPSIDRIDNSKGYIPGNVWVISAQANAIKSSATSAQILKVAAWLKHL